MLELSRKALSIRQPWAHLILHECKQVESGSWMTSYRGPVLLHAAKGLTSAEWDDAMDLLEAISRQNHEANRDRRDCIRANIDSLPEQP